MICHENQNEKEFTDKKKKYERIAMNNVVLFKRVTGWKKTSAKYRVKKRAKEKLALNDIIITCVLFTEDGHFWRNTIIKSVVSKTGPVLLTNSNVSTDVDLSKIFHNR